MAMRQEFRVPEDISERSQEEQEEWRQKEKENRQRLTKEDLQDMIYKKKQENKLLKELEEGEKTTPVKKPTEREQIEEERRMADEFMAKQRGEEKKLEELMSDPSLSVQEPEGGHKCVNQVGGEPCGNPASMMLTHGGLLGDTPPITLCKHCSKLLSLIPLSDEAREEQYMQGVVGLDKLKEGRRGALTKWKIEYDKRKWKEKELKRKKSNTSHILQKIAGLADKLDARGLHDEADLLDTILNSGLK